MRSNPRRLVADAYPWAVAPETRFADMDINHHLNNVAVARLYEESRVRFHAHIRATWPEIGQPHSFIAHLEIDYLAEGRYPAPVAIGLATLSLGRSSYRIGMGLFQSGHCIGLCDAVLVHRDGTGPAPIPPVLRDVLGEFTFRA